VTRQLQHRTLVLGGVRSGKSYWAEQQLAGDPALKPAGLAGPIAEAFGVRVHPRSIERALARRREHSKSR